MIIILISNLSLKDKKYIVNNKKHGPDNKDLTHVFYYFINVFSYGTATTQSFQNNAL